jgi:hypothetical protein
MYTGPKIVSDGLVMGLDFASKRGEKVGSACKNIVDAVDQVTFGMNVDGDGNMVLGGTQSRIELDTNVTDALDGTDEATLEIWGKNVDDSNAGNQSGLVSLTGLTANSTLWMYSTQAIYLDIFRPTRYTVSTNSSAWFNALEWWHLSVSTKLGASGYRVMINGVHRKATTGVTITTINATLPTRLGNSSGTRWFEGLMGSMFLYNRALTDEEKISNYNAQKNRFR